MSAYDKEAALIDQAKREGIEEGVEESKKEIVIEMLNKGMDIELISEITKMSVEEIKKIQIS